MAGTSHRVRQTQHNIQCLYNFDRRIHTVQAYPVLSPQGASIVLYGHENGVTVVWRGGRRLKEPRPAKPATKSTAKSDASVMVLDSDSDGNDASASSNTFSDKAVFENTPTEPIEGGFPDVVQTLDLAFGTAVYDVAVLPIAPCTAKDAEPSQLQEQMVFAVVCATADVYLVTLPLAPPSHESKTRPQLRSSLLASNAGHGAFGEVLIPLGGPSKCCKGIAITLAKQKPVAVSGAASTSARTRSGNARPASTLSVPPMHIIVAAHSSEASGTLRLWDVTMSHAKRASNAVEPFQTVYLANPLAGLAFNPTHPTQLLVVDPQHAVRVYDYTLPAIPSDEMSDGPFPPQGSWLLSLYPPFCHSSTMSASRKPIVAAAWISHGHAILVLLADSQWGIWDIDRAGSSSGGVLGGRSATSGIRGAALTAFNVSGQIEGTPLLRNPAAGSRKSVDKDFEPMTPHTRRDVLAAAFGASTGRITNVRGGIEVVQQRSVRGSETGTESAVLWLGGSDYVVAMIPDVERFWDSQLRRGAGASSMGLFSSARPTRMIRMTDLDASLLGERCCGASVFFRTPQRQPRSAKDNGDDVNRDDDEEELNCINKGDKDLAPLEVLVQGESRLVVVRESNEDAFSGALASRLQTAASRTGRNVGGDTVNSAIIVKPHPLKGGTVTFDLEANERLATGSLHPQSLAAVTPQAVRHRRRPLTNSLFETPSKPAPSTGALAPTNLKALTPSHRSLFDENEVTLTMSMMKPARRGRPDVKLAFAGDLDDAANASDDEEAAEDRNIEEEMLDIMEIDRELEALEEERGADSHNVFFEGE